MLRLTSLFILSAFLCVSSVASGEEQQLSFVTFQAGNDTSTPTTALPTTAPVPNPPDDDNNDDPATDDPTTEDPTTEDPDADEPTTTPTPTTKAPVTREPKTLVPTTKRPYTKSPSPGKSDSSSSSSLGAVAIAGITIGGIFALSVFAALIVCLVKRHYEYGEDDDDDLEMYNTAAASAGFYNNRQHAKRAPSSGQVVYEIGEKMNPQPSAAPAPSMSRGSFDPDKARELSGNRLVSGGAAVQPEQRNDWWNAMNDTATDHSSSDNIKFSQDAPSLLSRDSYEL